jgi:hypothetical protein
VDLRSNGHGRARAPWTAPCARCTGPRWTAPFKTKGYAILAIRARSNGPGRVQARAAAASPERGGARRELAGVDPRRRSRPPLRPRAGAKRSAGTCARDQGVKGGDRASPAASTGRGRRGCSGELVEALLCVKGREIGRGLKLTVACRMSSDGGSGKRSEGAGPRRRRSRRRSGGR